MPFPPPFYRWRPHPWHGLDVGPRAPKVVQAYIELTPFDFVKYEIDKETGYLRIDRPQRSSAVAPTLYGFIPRTYCGKRIAAFNPKAKSGDADPLDICVIAERPINRAEILLHARVIGGLMALDGEEADDKIIAILDNDSVMSGIQDVRQLPPPLLERLRHFFLTYKMIPGQPSPVTVERVYGADQAYEVVKAAIADYEENFGQQG